MADSEIRIYSEFVWKPEYALVPRSYRGYVAIFRGHEGSPSVGVKRWSGDQSSGLYELPGGELKTEPENDLDSDDTNGFHRMVQGNCQTALRQACSFERGRERDGCTPIGLPLYLPINEGGVLVKVDCVQVYSASMQDDGLVFVNPSNIDEYKICSENVDLHSPDFGRMHVMLWDALSILETHCWYGPSHQLTGELIDLYPRYWGYGYGLYDGGNYLMQTAAPGGSYVGIYLNRRLNPNQPKGYFRGNAEHLVAAWTKKMKKEEAEAKRDRRDLERLRSRGLIDEPRW